VAPRTGVGTLERTEHFYVSRESNGSSSGIRNMYYSLYLPSPSGLPCAISSFEYVVSDGVIK